MTAITWQNLLHPGKATDFFSRGAFPPFDPAITGYNRANARWLAELSRLVYRHDIEEQNPPPEPTRTGFLQHAGFRQRGFYISQETDTQAMLAETVAQPGFAVLVFRGTEQNIKDFISDLEIGAPLQDQHQVLVHQGFEEALDSVWNSIEADLAKLSCPVYYAGHSLGAALATLAAARHAPKALYTFGSPRVGNAAFAASLDDRSIHRIVDDQDIVTTVPPESLGFRHVGAVQLLKEAPTRSLFSWIGRLVSPPKPLADHAPINYVDRL